MRAGDSDSVANLQPVRNCGSRKLSHESLGRDRRESLQSSRHDLSLGRVALAKIAPRLSSGRVRLLFPPRSAALGGGGAGERVALLPAQWNAERFDDL